MNIKALHDQGKAVSAKVFFRGEQGSTTALQILQNQQLKKHITNVPALLICVEGKVVFNNEQGMEVTLLPGDYVAIKPMVTHWVDAMVDSYLLLIK